MHSAERGYLGQLREEIGARFQFFTNRISGKANIPGKRAIL